MEIELNTLVRHFTDTAFQVKGVYHYIIDPGKTDLQRLTPFPGFVFPIRGQAQFHFDGTPYMVSAGNVVHGGSGMTLDKRVVGNGKWEYISVLYDVYDVPTQEPSDFRLADVHFKLSMGQSTRLTEILWRLWRTFNQPGAIPAFQTETLFRCALEEMFVCARNQSNHGAQVLFERMAAYIQENYMDLLTVRGLAEIAGVNENRLFYVFSKYAGMGPGDYLMAYRLNRAKELLITSDAPVGIVAKSVGYVDALYFSRIFKKHFAISPSGLREKFRNNPYEFQDDSIPT